MGRGDRKTAKGKIAKRSYGNKRSHTANTTAATKAVAKPSMVKKPIAPAVKPAAPKPTAAPKKKA